MSKLIKSFNVCIGETAKYEEEVDDNDIVKEYPEDEEEDIYRELENVEEEEREEFAHQKAEEILKKAQESADGLVEEASIKMEEEREIVLEQARKNGFEDGYDQAMRQFEDLIQEAGEIKQQAIDEYKDFIDSVEEEFISLVFDIARKVVSSELTTKKEDIIDIVRDALEACKNKEYILLKVSEEDYESIMKAKNKLLAMVKGIGEIEIKVDRSLEHGGCLLETPFGAVDGSAKTKLDQIEKAFKGLIER